jgi:HD superfamily phosphohydrolase
VHGYHLQAPHEVAVIDCPLVQRLRYIHQTAFAYLVYPTANHTRFDHSLGMSAIAERMLRALEVTRDVPETRNPTVRREVRLAALLHDVGHTFFSHLSESILAEKFREWFYQIKKMTFAGRGRFFGQASAGEILSYVIITCKPARDYIAESLALNDVTDVDLDRVAALIVAQPPDPEHQFMADIINSPMDADKIDYLLRDCHFSGIHAEVDPERIYYTLDIIRLPGWRQYLTVGAGGIPHFEQMILAKMMLHTSIYHHHKIRALECMVRGIFETIEEQGVSDPNLRFEQPVDYLGVPEYEWFTRGLADPVTGPMVRQILDRRLLKRALVISRNTVAPDTRLGLSQFHKLRERGWAEMHDLRKKVFELIPAKYQTSVADVWVDIPPPPDIHRAAQHWVMSGIEPQPLSESFPSSGWLRSYEANKLRAHVFYIADRDSRLMAAAAAEEVLEEEYGLKFESLGKVQAKLE